MINKITQKKTLRDFGLIIGFGFPIFIGLVLPFITGHNFRLWTFSLGVPAILLGIFKPNLLLYPYKFWMLLGHILGWINSKLILSLIYILVLIPISCIMNLLGHDPLKKKKSCKASYREIVQRRNYQFTKIF